MLHWSSGCKGVPVRLEKSCWWYQEHPLQRCWKWHLLFVDKPRNGTRELIFSEPKETQTCLPALGEGQGSVAGVQGSPPLETGLMLRRESKVCGSRRAWRGGRPRQSVPATCWRDRWVHPGESMAQALGSPWDPGAL